MRNYRQRETLTVNCSFNSSVEFIYFSSLFLLFQSLGNHEFDDGVEGLVPFLNNISAPVVTCNLDLKYEPELENSPLKPSIVIQTNGVKIGIIGYLTPETKVSVIGV